MRIILLSAFVLNKRQAAQLQALQGEHTGSLHRSRNSLGTVATPSRKAALSPFFYTSTCISQCDLCLHKNEEVYTQGLQQQCVLCTAPQVFWFVSLCCIIRNVWRLKSGQFCRAPAQLHIKYKNKRLWDRCTVPHPPEPASAGGACCSTSHQNYQDRQLTWWNSLEKIKHHANFPQI